MAKRSIPDYQIIALANLDLSEHMDENPMVLKGGQRIKWDVEETEFHYIAKGVIRIPVEIYFSKPEDPDTDPEVRRVIIAGKREFDARLEEIDEDDVKSQEKKTYGIDESAARAESFVRYKKSMADVDRRKHV